jgi:hypothetical protein
VLLLVIGLRWRFETMPTSQDVIDLFNGLWPAMLAAAL